MIRQKNIGLDAALKKIKQYCAYQERSHMETKDKLFGFGLYPYEVDEILANLVEENYLNEERFALAYAGGKFSMKQWGKQKIAYGLKQKQVSQYCIKKALSTIDDEAYEATLMKLAQAKNNEVSKDKNLFSRRKKLYQYLAQKGFESQKIQQCLETMEINPG